MIHSPDTLNALSEYWSVDKSGFNGTEVICLTLMNAGISNTREIITCNTAKNTNNKAHLERFQRTIYRSLVVL